MLLRLLLRLRRRRRRNLALQSIDNMEVEIPYMVYRYAEGISRVTGLPLGTVLRSYPVKKYMDMVTRTVRVPLSQILEDYTDAVKESNGEEGA